MKYLFLIIAIFLSLNFGKPQIVFAQEKYARAINSTNLYKLTSDNELGNIICVVEKTYFVQILSETGDLFKVNYNGVSGYVKKNDVKEITSKPSTPYPYNIKLTIGSDCNLRSSPTTKSQVSNILNTLRSGETNLEFVGRVYADEAIDFGGTTWYLVNYLGEYGYVYNKYVKSISPIYENTENVTFASNQDNKIQNPITHTPSLILIIIMSIPLILILFILYLPRRNNKKQKPPKVKKVIDKY